MGYIQLQRKKRTLKQIIPSAQTDPQPVIDGTLDQLSTIECQLVTDKNEIKQWNEYVDRYHYLKYKHPIAYSLKYFIVSKKEGKTTRLDCLLFSSAAWQLVDRDKWIGWQEKDRKKRLNLVINNARFLVSPWVKVPNLASKALSTVTRRIQDDWQDTHAYRPVLIEYLC